jgi:hypothetical protein
MFMKGKVLLLLVVSANASPVVLVTGATGKTGSLIYNMLKEQGVTVRGFVRNATKAQEVLKCTKCDASEGIYIGDVTKPEDLKDAVQGATALAICTSAIPHCTDFKDPSSCSYPKTGYPKDVDWLGGKAQVTAFAMQNKNTPGPVVLISSMGTTEPDSFLDKLGNGHIGFYKLNEESYIMGSGMPWTIIKPCGLSDDEPGKRELLAGHDDEMHETPPMIPRADVARVAAKALLQPSEAVGLRFDLCSRAGNPTTDVAKVFAAARYPWQSKAPKEALV